MRVTFSPINNTNFTYNKSKSSKALTSTPMNILSKDAFSPSFSGNYETRLTDFLWKRKDNLLSTLEPISKLITPKTINKLDKDGNSPLYLASWFEAPTVVISQLLKKGARVNLKNKYGESPLSIAAFNGNERIVERLLKAGANINSKDQYRNTPLTKAISSGTSEVAKLLVDNGAEIKRANRDGQLPIHLAAGKDLGGYTSSGELKNASAETSLIELMKTLLKNGNDVNAKDKFGATPLFSAAHNDCNVMKFLIDNGADVSIRDKQDKTALHYAVTSYGPVNDVISKIQLLLDNGVDINAKDNSGKTALYRACKSGYPEVKRFLLEKGADPSQIVTVFHNLGDNAIKDYPEIMLKEINDSGLDKLPAFIKSDRHWKYWSISLPEGMVLPHSKAIKLNQAMGEDVRAFGYAGGMDAKTLNTWMKNNNGGVNNWHVDTQEGLTQLVSEINSILKSKKK